MASVPSNGPGRGRLPDRFRLLPGLRRRAWGGFRGLSLLVLLPAAFLAAAAIELAGCNKRETPQGDPLVAKGKVVYATRCIACHSMNPSKDGTLGPAIKDASLELLKARVIHGTYPPGYTPKRATRIMVKLPLTEADVEAIHAFLSHTP